MKRFAVYFFSALWLILGGCATPRKQTCPPHDDRCAILKCLSEFDIGPRK